MSGNTAPKASLKFPVVKGHLRHNGNEIEMQWSVQMGNDGAISLSFQPVEVRRDTAWLMDVAYSNTTLLPSLSMSGTTPDGVKISSENVHIISITTTSAGNESTMQVVGKALRLRATYREVPADSIDLTLTYFAVGMTGFGSPSTVTTAGRVSVYGPTQIDNPDDINGEVVFESPSETRSTENWIKECDALAEQVLDMVSFAEGHFIRWSVRRLKSNSGLITLDCDGAKPTGPAHDAVFSSLHLQPFVELAVTQYTKEMRERTGLQVALEWFLHRPRYAELQLLSAVSALEHLVSVFYKYRSEPTIVAPAPFEALCQEIDKLWPAIFDEAEKTAPAEVKRLRDNIGGANRGSFRDKLQNMLKVYSVPTTGLEADIAKAIVARNRVVHTGLYRSQSRGEIYEHVTVLRELLKRIFLTLLQYSGPYQSSRQGMEWKRFPLDIS